MYHIVKIVEPAVSDGGEPLSFDVTRYYATARSDGPITDGSFPDPFVEAWTDGSITAKWRDQSLFLYQDQWRAIIDAVRMAIEDKRVERAARKSDWLNDTIDAKEFHGTPVDLSRRQTLNALNGCAIDIEGFTKEHPWTRPYITINGERLKLGRTDLKDDVATGLCANNTAEEWRSYYLEKAAVGMGARIRNGLFSVIDAYSDG